MKHTHAMLYEMTQFMINVQLGGIIVPNRQQCYLNAKGEYEESINEVRVKFYH